MTRIFNKNLPYGTIHGAYADFPSARYSQKGALFDPQGKCVALMTDKGAIAYDPKKEEPAQSSGAGQATESAARKELETLGTKVKGLQQQLSDAEAALDQAKAGDINAADYTAKCADAQKLVTNLKRELTKTTNAAAVLEEKVKAMEEGE